MRARARSFPRLKGEGTLVDADFKGEFKQGPALPGPEGGANRTALGGDC